MLAIICWGLVSPILFVTAAFTTEVLLGLARKAPAKRFAVDSIQAVVLVPAHNEEKVLGSVLEHLGRVTSMNMSVLVVADNCQDGTANIARAHQAHVLERTDTLNRGKSYALQHGIDYLRSAMPDVVVVLDADCYPDPGALELLVGAAHSTGRPVQGEYVFRTCSQNSQIVQISNFAVFLKNSIRQRGLSRLRAPALLTGTGMAFPWKVISSVDLASGSVVEDLQLTIDLTKAGREPIFVSDARIWSHAAGETATLVQRTRWEGGFLATARQSALPLLYEGLRRCRWPEFWLAIHLLTPPLALLIALNLLAALLMGTLSIYLSDWVHVACVSGLQLGTAGSLLGSWLVGGKAYLPLAGILKLPAYVLWKIPMYARVFRGQKISWKRTER